MMPRSKNRRWSSYPDNILRDEMGGIFFAPTTLTTIPNCLHYHSQLELGLCLRGCGVFYICNEIYPFEQGDVSVIYPGENHIAQSAPNMPADWVFITVDVDRLFAAWPDGERLRRLYTREKGQSRILDPVEKGQVVAYIRRMIALHEDNERSATEKIAHYTSLLACILYESEAWEPNASATALAPESLAVVSGRGMAIYPAIQHIFAHYTEDLTVDQLCDVCAISPVHLRRMFCTVVGMSPLSFLHKIRISHACSELSSTNLPVLVIAGRCGYNTLSSFNRQFRKIMRMSPREYRAAQRLFSE